jgi:LmbE family N-acetylglucosaminyl deacetylase
MKTILSGIFLFILSTSLVAQRPIQSSADILQEIKKLKVVGNALYLAAHPDDENTRLISWLENERLVRTAYLSLTRGDGGQNLIGTEKGAAMGVLRTQELLEARKIDGGEQFFSRAVDFGYSKTAEETLEIWDKQKVLADVVWVIRKFRPDVIITRFPSDSRGGHGHHTASAMLAQEAFELAGDKNAFPEQLEFLETWQPKRILWDVYWWNTEVRDEAIKSGNILQTDIGDYNEILGLSYSEIASDSRSQHKSQGFGTARSRGSKIEYLKHTAGEPAKDKLFDGINTTWSRIDGGEKIEQQIANILNNYNAADPSKSVDGLVKLYGSLLKSKDNFYVKNKIEDLKQIILAAAGIYTEALADEFSYAPKQEINGKFSLIVRSKIPFKLHDISPIDSMPDSDFKGEINQEVVLPFSFKAPSKISQPYWLWGDYFGIFEVENQQLIGLPENPTIQTFNYSLSFPPNQTKIQFSEAIDYKWSTRVDGELHRDLVISPEVTANLSQQVYLTKNEEKIQLGIILEAHKADEDGEVSLDLPKGWTSSPQSIKFSFQRAGQQEAISFEVSPPKSRSEGELKVLINGKTARSIQRIDYDHIKPQTFFPKAQSKVVKMDLQTKVEKVGYIIGSGDEVAENLKSVGFEVESFKAELLPLMDLSRFETIIVGIRAYNINDAMINGNNILSEYVKNGGTVIVQYNTNRGLIAEEIGPYPFELSRNRVTKEEAKPTFLKPNHPILNSPNQLTEADFDNWVQERGLYFAGEWDKNYETIIAWNDPGEAPHEGSLIVADYGKGKFIYTGISFFRQLPSGVPGAFRLLTNLISYGK